MVFKSSPSRPGEKKCAASTAPGNRWIWRLQSSPRRVWRPRRAPQSDLAMGARGAAGEKGARGNRRRETEQSCAREEIAPNTSRREYISRAGIQSERGK